MTEHVATRGIVLSEGFAGLEAQAAGLAERAGLLFEKRRMVARAPWRWVPASRWLWPLGAVEGIGALEAGDADGPVLLTVGGMGGAVGAALRRRGHRVVQIQNPRMRLDGYDLVVANTHDRISGPNVLVSRTALHRITPAVLAEARERWQGRLEALPRPLVAVLVGGANGRFRFGAGEAAELAASLAAMMRRDRVGVALTPSRRTGDAQRAVLREALEPAGAFVWAMEGENPYLGLLACADAVVVTGDSVSMVSEAAATAVPVSVVTLPGRSRRIGAFLRTMIDAGRVRPFNGRHEDWTVSPLDDTGAVSAEMCRRLGLPGPS
ncbi:MAG: mitochondrial fission ELM1 family protein [Gluconacetobacter diazotrophicus]|nr:mitochondrial fission ELM1 family protein [Gluconacetobacter diazotrophicus]